LEAVLSTSKVSAESDKVARPHGQHAATINVGGKFPRGGFLGFLQVYPNLLTRLGFSGMGNDFDACTRIGGSSSDLVAESEQEKMSKEKAISGNATGSKETANDTKIVESTAIDTTAAGTNDGEAKQTTYQVLTRGRYQLSTLVFVGLIAFLIGSLLRSLLSPADFIYVESDRHEMHEEGGWREIRRLVEIKYLFGGWDFQVAVVRRH